MMIQTLATNLYTATRAAYRQADKPNKHLPVTKTVLLRVKNGTLHIAPFAWDTDRRKEAAQTCGALVYNDFETCPPAKPLIDWLNATREKHGIDAVSLEYDPARNILTAKTHNTRATFHCIPAGEFPPTETE